MNIYLILAVLLGVAALPAYARRCSDEFLRRIQRNPFEGKTITIVSTDDTPSFVEQTGEGVPYGFNVDLMNLVGFIYRTNFNYVFKNFNELIAAVEADEDTISVDTQTITQERIQQIRFAQFFKSGTGFLVKTSFTGSITGLSSLCGRRVAVVSGSTQEADVVAQNTRCGSNSINMRSVDGIAESTQLVLNGSADVALGDEATLVPIVRESSDELKTIGTPYNVQPYGIGCNKNSRQLCCAIAKAINYLIEAGVYGDLLTRYSFTYPNNGICPSRINLQGETCASRCKPGAGLCRQNLS